MVERVQIEAAKKRIRAEAFRRRKGLDEREVRSAAVLKKWSAVVSTLAETPRAGKILYYLSQHSEVETLEFVRTALNDGPQVVPFCEGDHLRLFALHEWSELEAGSYGILEPGLEYREDPERRVEPADIRAAMIPGVAFDSTGGRLGHGKGYYDRLLAEMKNTVTIGIAFDVQMFPAIPMAEHDLHLDFVVTETSTIRVEKN